MSTVVLVPAHARLGEGFSRQERLKAREHPGRRIDGHQTAASWISDLVALKKCVLLCSFCRPWFNPKRYGYRRFYSPDLTGKTDGYQVNGRCDRCKQHTVLIPGGGTEFIAEETYSLVCIDPLDARRKARAAARRMTAWERISRGSARPREARAGQGA